jgi:hypothetical protein
LDDVEKVVEDWMSFVEDNTTFEQWLRTQCDVVEGDLDRKHRRMRKNGFVFLRATFFRWAKLIERWCLDLNDAPAVLSVGDAHVENFGTWRDAEGRLVWGVNDFDDAAIIPFAFDLVRLAASARLAQKLAIRNREAAEAILRGYRNGLTKPRPTLLDEHAIWMRAFVACSDGERERFWANIDALPSADPPAEVKRSLKESLPADAVLERFTTRVKGGGSLGRPRYTAIAAWRGGRVVREAKALVASGWDWAHGNATAPSRFLMLANGRHRSPDPFLRIAGGFVFRRIAADARKAELGESAAILSERLLEAMGFDVGSIHASSLERPSQVLADLDGRAKGWLHTAAKISALAVRQDFEEWVR